MSVVIVGGDYLAQMTGGVFELGAEYTSVETEYASPASIMAAYITGETLMSSPAAAEDWPLYVSHLPSKPDVLGAVYNTTPSKDGRAMQDGVVMQHYGVQIIIRAEGEEIGWDKCNAIATNLDSIVNDIVLFGDGSYTIHSVSRIGGVNSLGLEPGTTRHRLFSMNFITTISEN